MLSKDTLDFIGLEHQSPVVSAIYNIGQSVISRYVQNFSTYIDYVYADSAKPSWEFLASTTTVTGSLTKSEVSEGNSVIIESLILGDNRTCQNAREFISAIVCERWLIRCSKERLSTTDAIPWDKALCELEAYFKSSPLSFWLKEHFQSKRFKLTHRVFHTNATKTQLGVPFVTTMSKLLEASSADLCVVDYSPSMNNSSLKADSRGRWDDYLPFHSQMCHAFSPISVEPDGILTLTVISPERMPPLVPEYPFLTSDWNQSVFPKDNDDASFLSSKCELPSCEFSRPHKTPASTYRLRPPPEHIPTPVETKPIKQVVNSPVVLMTTTDRTFAPDSLNCSDYDITLFPLSQFDSVSESATSTLTKKSRSPKTNESNQPSSDYPPRKQQRVSDSAPSPAESSHRIGTLDKVIADFTQLNMELVESPLTFQDHDVAAVTANSTSNINDPVIFTGNDSVPCDDTVVEYDCSSTRAAVTTSLSRSLSSRANNVHRSVERRRNAASACAPTCCPVSRAGGSVLFNRRTGLPLQSSPVPLKRSTSGRFDFDSSIGNLKPALSSACMFRTCARAAEKSSPTEGSNSHCTSSGSNQEQRRRRRPASLRLNTTNISKPLPPHSSPAYANEMDQAEISCSAPPSSGDRQTSMRAAIVGRDRMANTLACTPVSYSSSQHLLVNFEESMLNGRIHPVGEVVGFTLELGASGSFFPDHERLPLTTYFFDLSDDNKPSPYLGYADLSHLRNGKGYHVPVKGSVQLTLFNPNKFVVKMFVIGYDFEDMPPNSQTFLRQRTVYMPVESHQPARTAVSTESPWFCGSTASLNELSASDGQTSDNHLSVPDVFWGSSRAASNETSLSPSMSSCSCSSLSSVCSSSSNRTVNSINGRSDQPAFLRYLVHLRFHTTRSRRLYLHTDLRLIFARDKFEFDARVATYELRSFVDAPTNPRYSPKKWTKRQRSGASRLSTPCCSTTP